MFDAFFNAIAALLAWFYELPVVGGSVGMAIILLTLTIMLLVTPLNVKATRSMMTMSALAPEMKKIQQEFADDRQRMNEELLAFYRENKINPVGGCLPMLLQIPFFIVLYQVIYGLTRKASSVETVVAGGRDVVVEVGSFLPKYLDQMPDSQLYIDLVGQTSIDFVGLDLARSAATALQSSFTTGIPYILLILAVAGTAFLQQKQMSMRNPNAEVPAQQKMLLRIMPLFFAVISFNFAAGLVIYFFVSNLYRIIQNAAISMRLYNLSLGQALLGIGSASLPGATSAATGGSKASSDRSSTGKASTGKASTGKASTGKASTGKASTDKKDPPAKGGSAARKASPGKRDPSSDNWAKGTGGSKGAKPRPISGRVTPPGQRPSNAPPRRKKKRT